MQPEFSVLLDRTVTLADLAAHPLITLGAGTTSHDFYAAVFARRGVPFQPVIEAATADQIIPMAEAGLGRRHRAAGLHPNLRSCTHD